MTARGWTSSWPPDRRGRPITLKVAAGTTVKDLAESFGVPHTEIEVILVDMPERGVIGVGEPATIPTAGAIANAVANAIGVRVNSLPITPARVLAALGKVGKVGAA